jgi:hypothetical protein
MTRVSLEVENAEGPDMPGLLRGFELMSRVIEWRMIGLYEWHVVNGHS